VQNFLNKTQAAKKAKNRKLEVAIVLAPASFEKDNLAEGCGDRTSTKEMGRPKQVSHNTVQVVQRDKAG
jgi:hypothetical protein